MLIGLKLLVIISWLVMVLMIIFAPTDARSNEYQIVSILSDWGSEPEFQFYRTLHKLPRVSQLLIVDDMTDSLRTQILERLLVHHSGVVGVNSVGPAWERNLHTAGRQT